MLPTFRSHRDRYSVGLLFGLTLLCLLQVFALVRNSAALGLLELLPAGIAIVGGITYAVLRDAPGYWIYSTLAAKFMLSKDELSELQGLRISPLMRWLNPLQHPLRWPVLLALLVSLLLLAGRACFPAHSSVLAVVVIGLIFPLLLSLLVLGSARYFLALASPEGEASILEIVRRPRAASAYRREDLLITLAINFVLIWPLHSRPAFSLVAGYGEAKFVVAAVLLGWIAAFFTLLGARRSRLLSAVGEVLSGLFCTQQLKPGEPGKKLKALPRMLGYYALIALWALLLCALLAQLPMVVPFALFSLLLLPMLGWIFWHERGLTLQHDYAQAVQYIEELAVMPVSVPRRSYEFK